MSSKIPLCLLVVAFSAVPLTARADVPPPDACTAVDSACNNAGPSYNQPGVCASSTCSRPTPDGSMQYSCYRCMLQSGTGGGSGTGGADGSAAGAGGATGGSAGSTGAGGTKDEDDGGCSCNVGTRKESGSVVLTLAIGLSALSRRFRRR